MDPDGTSVSLGSQRLQISGDVFQARPALASYRGKKVVVGIRPEHISAAISSDGPVLQGDVELVEALGSELLVHFSLDAALAHVPGAAVNGETERPPAGDVDATISGWSVARVDASTKIRMHERVTFALRPGLQHFFDADTGAAIWDGPA